MRRWRFIFPIIVLVIVTIAGYVVVSSRRIAVIRMFDEAGRKGEPIIIFRGFEPGFFPMYVLSPNHEPVRLFTRDMGLGTWFPVFSQAGTLHLLEEYGQSNEHVNQWEIAFPDIRAQKTTDWETSFFDDMEFVSFPIFGSDRFLLRIDNDTEYRVLDIETGDYTNHIFETPPPFDIYNPKHYSPETYEISKDRTVIVARERYSTGFLLWNIWRYDIPLDAWSEVLERQEGHLISVGPEGRVMGIRNTQVTPDETNYVDGVTGELLHTVQEINSSIIGERWIACEPKMGSGELLLIDMDDNWKEYRIDLDTYWVIKIAMYIPPPGGVEEMLAMREAE